MEKNKKDKIAEDSLKSVLQENNEMTQEEMMHNLQVLASENQKLKMQMHQMADAYKDMQLRLGSEEYKNRLEYLWRVVTNVEHFTSEFVAKCTVEFEDMLFPPMSESLKEDA